jgi:hypothetical protein
MIFTKNVAGDIYRRLPFAWKIIQAKLPGFRLIA